MNTTAFYELSTDELYETEGGIIGAILTVGGALIGFTLAYRDEISSGLVDGYNSVMGK